MNIRFIPNPVHSFSLNKATNVPMKIHLALHSSYSHWHEFKVQGNSGTLRTRKSRPKKNFYIVTTRSTNFKIQIARLKRKESFSKGH